MKKILMIAVMALALLASCSSGEKEAGSQYEEMVSDMDLPSSVKEDFKTTSMLMDELALAVRSFNLTQSEEDFSKIADLQKRLSFIYDGEDLSETESRFCAEHKFRVDSARVVVSKLLEQNISMIRRSLAKEDDKLFENTVEYPFYLPKGTVLYLDFETSGTTTARLHNADSHSVLRTWTGKKQVSDSLVITNGAIYLLELSPKDAQYLTLNARRNCKDIDDFNKEYKVVSEEKECAKGEARARKIEGIKISSIFEEPRKVTLRSQGKALFSGGARSVVTMQVPANCTDLLYSLRISTSQSDSHNDGQFCDKVDSKYKKIKLLGLPLYESQGSSSNLFRELLNASAPEREEEAYCNIFVFTKADQAKKFSEGAAVSTLKYDVSLSKQGSQSCNDRISTKGMKTIYFGFENTRVRYSVYLWLEALSTVHNTEYVKNTYVLASEKDNSKED